jgi:hypothetical protein
MAWSLGFSRRRGRTAFWLLGSRRLAVAVLEPTTDEPLLVACATLVLDEAPAGDDFAPGLLETAAAAAALRVPHVAALDREWCRLDLDGSRAARRAAGDDPGTAYLDVEGGEGVVVASRAAVARAAERFRSAGLRLASLDCADCALLNLAAYLGRAPDCDAARVIEEASTLDPLTAVSVAPECEAPAARAADSLGVPVGLALRRFGLLDHA